MYRNIIKYAAAVAESSTDHLIHEQQQNDPPRHHHETADVIAAAGSVALGSCSNQDPEWYTQQRLRNIGTALHFS